MKRSIPVFVAAALLPFSLSVAQAKPPADIADLVGARAPGAESEMQNRGYVDVKNNTWWNPAAVCNRMMHTETHPKPPNMRVRHRGAPVFGGMDELQEETP